MDAQQLAHLSRLAMLQIAPEKQEIFLQKMDQVLAFITQIQNCPIDESSLEIGDEMVLQPRSSGEAYAEPASLITTSSHPIVQGQIVVKTGEVLDNG